MCGLTVGENEIPEVIVRRLCLGNFIVRLRLAGVDKVGELDGILNEEDRNVVANNVPVALLGVKLDSKASNIPNGVSTASASKDGGEADEDRCLAGCVRQYWGVSEVSETLVDSKCSKGASATGMYDTLGNTLMVKTVDL